MQNEQNEAHNEGNVNESSGNVKCEKSEQPKNNEDCGDQSKHVLSSFYFRVRANQKLHCHAHSTESGFWPVSCTR